MGLEQDKLVVQYEGHVRRVNSADIELKEFLETRYRGSDEN